MRPNPQRIPADELRRHLTEGAGWSDGECQRHLDACLDLHLLQGGSELRLHQLFAGFLRLHPAADELREAMRRIVRVQAQRMLAVARALAANPNQPALAAGLLVFPTAPDPWDLAAASIAAADGEILGRALYETGRHDAARPWFERAVAEKEQGDVHGRVDHASLGTSLEAVAYCSRQLGRADEAAIWEARAAEARRAGDDPP